MKAEKPESRSQEPEVRLRALQAVARMRLTEIEAVIEGCHDQAQCAELLNRWWDLKCALRRCSAAAAPGVCPGTAVPGKPAVGSERVAAHLRPEVLRRPAIHAQLSA